MKTLIAAIIAGLAVASVHSQELPSPGMRAELEDAFLEKKQTSHNFPHSFPTQTSSAGPSPIAPRPDPGDRRQVRVAAILGIPAAPRLDDLQRKILDSPGARFIVAVFDTGEQGIVRKASVVDWTRITGVLADGSMPVLHILPGSGGSFKAGGTIYSLVNGTDTFQVSSAPANTSGKQALSFSGASGAFITADGFLCRIARYADNKGGLN